MPATAQGAVDIAALLDSRITRHRVLIFLICFAIALADGLDSQLISVTAPAMANEFQFPLNSLGPIFAASHWGAVIGGLVFGACADRWGRRNLLIAMSLLFSSMTIATVWSNSFLTIWLYRFVAGIGIGGAVPCFVALVSEYAPTRWRAGVVTGIWTAIPAGGILAGLLGAYLIGSFGWRGIYLVAGIFSLMMSVLVVWGIPESLGFMVTRNFAPERIRRVLQHIAPGVFDPAANRFLFVEEKKSGVPLRHLFTERRAVPSILIAAAFLFCFTAIIGSLVWMPVLLKAEGMSAEQASLAVAFDNVGGVLGTLFIGQLINLFRSYRILAFIFLAGAASLALLGQAAPHFIYVSLLAGAAGLLIGGGGSGLIAFTAALYPTFMRSTGVGWAMSFYRLAAATAPIFVGVLLTAKISVDAIFIVLAVSALLNVVIVLLLSSSVHPFKK
jgi:AAHS family 4-hydroxybenzoate transporter-like MFS transporter